MTDIAQAIRATYQNGVFAPEDPVALPEGATVTLWLDQPGTEIPHLRPCDRDFLDNLAARRSEVF